MDVRMTDEMITALRDTPEIPDNLKAALEQATPQGDAYLVPLDADQRMAMTEMCEWYVRSDPDSGELTQQGRLFDSIIQAIVDADLGGS